MLSREDAKIRVKLNVNKLFLSGEDITHADDYKDSVDYRYIEKNEKFYRLAGLVR